MGNWTDRFFANFVLSYNTFHDYYASSYDITQDYTLYNELLIHGKNMLTLYSDIEMYIKPLASNIKLNAGYTRSGYQDIVNGTDFQHVITSNYYLDLQFHSSFDGLFNFNIGSKISQFNVKTITENSAINDYSFLDILLKPSKKFDLKATAERYYFGNINGKKNYDFLDLKARYKVLQDKLILSVTGKNLLNTKSFVNYTLSDISISTVEYRLLPRYVMFGVAYNF